MTGRYSRSDIENAFPGGRWQPDGEYLVRSPLREERTASFRINIEKRNWKDFGSDEGGKLSDLFKMLGVADPWQGNQPSWQEPVIHYEKILSSADQERSKKAKALWEESKPTDGHNYLKRKKISIEGLRVDTEGNLLIPGYGIDGRIISVERISAKGEKRHLGPKQGAFFPVGDFKGDSPIILLEGAATAVSANQITEWPAIGCFGTAGLLPVAELFQKRYPGRQIVVSPDNDESGHRAGREARAAGFKVVSLPDGSKKGLDWNDLVCDRGLEAAQEAFQAQLEAARAARMENPEPAPEQEQPQGERSRRGFKLKRIGELEMTPPEFLVKGLLEKDTLISVFGPPESGKSFIALSLAACVSTGLPFMGRHVEEGPIVYIAGEGKAGILRRTAAWEIFNGVSLRDAPFYLSEGAADFLDNGGVVDVITAADEATQQEGRPPVLIVIDTVSRSFGSGDENSSQDMKKFVDSLDFLRERYTGAVVMAVHHSGVSETSRGRGSSVLRAALDAEFKVSRDGEVVRMESTKMKDAERPKPLSFALEDVPLGETIEGEAYGSAALRETEYSPEAENKLTPSMRRALETFRKAAKEAPTMDEDGRFLGVHVEDWRPVFYAAATASTTDGKWRAFDRARKDLVDRGKLRVENDIYTAVEPADELLTNHYARSLKNLTGNDTTTNNDNVDKCRSANMGGERQTTTHPLKGGVVSFPVCRPEEEKSGDIPSTARDEKMENHPSSCGEKYSSLEAAEAWAGNIPGRLSELKARAIKELNPSDGMTAREYYEHLLMNEYAGFLESGRGNPPAEPQRGEVMSVAEIATLTGATAEEVEAELSRWQNCGRLSVDGAGNISTLEGTNYPGADDAEEPDDEGAGDLQEQDASPEEEKSATVEEWLSWADEVMADE